MGIRCNLKFSPEKIVFLLFNRQGRNIARPLKIEGRKIRYVEEVKYLGVTLDNKLNWRMHINNSIDRCSAIMNELAAKTTGMFGPSPN